MKKTKIEWCDSTLNPVVGCTYGCSFCYAKKLNDRFHFVEDFTKPQFFPERLKQLDEKKPQIIFMDSMSDIADWTKEARQATQKAMLKNPQHIYLFLTKRVLDSAYTTPRTGWLGVSVTRASETDRYEELYDNAEWNRHFVSIEPLLDDITESGIHNFLDMEWVIIGAETGNRKEKVTPKKEWVDKIVAIAKEDEIPVFMKNSLLSIMGEENMLREFPKSFENQREKKEKENV